MKTPVFAAIFLAFSLFQTSSAQAHEVRPGFLQLKQINEHTYDLLWKIPAKGDRRLSLYVRIPGQCQSNDVTSRIADGAYIERRQVSCKGGLTGETIAIDGLQATRTDVLARVEQTNGQTQTIRLTPSAPEFTVVGSPNPLPSSKLISNWVSSIFCWVLITCCLSWPCYSWSTVGGAWWEP